MNLVVYSTIFGQTNPLHDPACPGSTRFVMFTDQDICSTNWEVVKVPPLERPKRECRKHKQPSHLVFPDADVTLWIDAAFRLLVDPLEIVERFPHEFVAFRHPARQRISQEAGAIIRAGKALRGPIMDQLAAYNAQGWDTPANRQKVLTNGGFLLRRHTERVKAFNELWHHEVQTRTLRDQMSIDYCAWKAGLGITHLPGNVYSNEFCYRYSQINPTNDF